MADEITTDVFIEAAPGEVFDYFTEPDLMVSWMGEQAQLDATPGGAFAVDVQGTAVRGHYLEIDRPTRMLISWGFERSTELPPGASTVEVLLLPERTGTRVTIIHRLVPPTLRDDHVTGWQRYLAALAARVRNPGDGR